MTDAATGNSRAGDRRLARWLWRHYVRRRLPWVAAGMVLMALEGSSMGALSYMIQPMFDDVFSQGRSGALVWVALAIAGLFILRALAGMGHRVIMSAVGERVAAELQTDLLRHLMTLDHGFYHGHSPGNLIERVRGDSRAVIGIFRSVLAALGRDAVALVSLFSVALWIDWAWTLIALVGAPLLILPIALLQRLVRRLSRAAREAAAHSSNRLDEIFHGINTVQLSGTEEREAGRFGDVIDTYVGRQVRAQASSAGIPAMLDIVAAIGFGAVLTYGGMQIIEGDKTVGEFMSFFTAMALVFEPLRRLGAISGTWQTALASLERIYAIFSTRPRVTSPARPTARPPAREDAGVELAGVTFAYDAAPVLQDVSFRAEPGRRTALVGPSGAGKSTVFALLTRLADPQDGRVCVGGRDVRDMDLAALRAMYSVVAQDAALFDETLRDNVLMGRSGVSEAQLREALDAAHVTEFLPMLPNGLDTPVGPRGSALSGGQRQRVAIARALLRDAPILLLDEATSALDAKSEAVVQQALDRLSQGRTTLVIAHRLATVREADKIIVMSGGRVVDEGRHETLLARGGVYADLCRLQFQDHA
ncbi:ABC transporter ATP-binding protein [Rhodobacteraceae bacterium WD3A24]|nr:ABC transporter ATP-binding protein [Rhodobacteraceae bacterium WD3A24]